MLLSRDGLGSDTCVAQVGSPIAPPCACGTHHQSITAPVLWAQAWTPQAEAATRNQPRRPRSWNFISILALLSPGEMVGEEAPHCTISLPLGRAPGACGSF